MTNSPLVSIIIVNYNGKHFLHNCLTSLSKLNFPKSKYEIILVDNNSKDTSVEYTRKNFQEVKIVENHENSGFAGGNNLGARHAMGKYVVLLNNDTQVEKNWLTYLIRRIESGKDVGAVNSKILLYFPFVEVSIYSDVYMRSEFTGSIDFQSVGVLVENVILENKSLQHLVRYRAGFYSKEQGAIQVRWTKGNAKVLIPCDPAQELQKVTFTIRSEKSNSNLLTNVNIRLGERDLVTDKLKSYEIKQYSISLRTADITDKFVYSVQNAGVIVFKNGYGRDRGAVVRESTQFYEIDNPFFGKAAEVHAFTGASVIIRKDVYEKLGGFDESFFMYYEDVDLSLRMRRIGWRVMYEPRSVVRHVHSGSSKEWSSFFTYNVEKNHLATLLKHFPLAVYLKVLCWYGLLLMISAFRMVRWRLKEDWDLYDEWREKTTNRMRVLRWSMRNLPGLIKKRLGIIRSQEKTMQEIYRTLY